jgi:hypothetical protein
MEKKLEDFTDIELKALAYDTLAQLQVSQRNLDTINGELSKRAQSAQSVQSSKGGTIPRLGDVDVV